MDRLHIAIGETGFSVCHDDHPVVGDCIIEGIQHLGVALEVHEMVAGELAAEDDPCFVKNV